MTMRETVIRHLEDVPDEAPEDVFGEQTVASVRAAVARYKAHEDRFADRAGIAEWAWESWINGGWGRARPRSNT